jgi:hypothetical protein
VGADPWTAQHDAVDRGRGQVPSSPPRPAQAARVVRMVRSRCGRGSDRDAHHALCGARGRRRDRAAPRRLRRCFRRRKPVRLTPGLSLAGLLHKTASACVRACVRARARASARACVRGLAAAELARNRIAGRAPLARIGQPGAAAARRLSTRAGPLAVSARPGAAAVSARPGAATVSARPVAVAVSARPAAAAEPAARRLPADTPAATPVRATAATPVRPTPRLRHPCGRYLGLGPRDHARTAGSSALRMERGGRPGGPAGPPPRAAWRRRGPSPAAAGGAGPLPAAVGILRAAGLDGSDWLGSHGGTCQCGIGLGP